MDIPALVRRQRSFFQSGATRPESFRREQLRRLEAALQAHEPALLQALRGDLRKPAQEAWASELGLVLSDLRHALRHLRAWMKPKRCRAPWLAWPARAWVQPEPYGVALILGPWNYPVHLLLSPLVGALAAGNCAVVKPSELAPQTAAALARLVRETFAEDHVAVVEGGPEIAAALLRERFDYIFFTGSTTVGRAVMAAAARHLTPVTLELGGKCPCLVCADAPVEVAARRIAWGKFLNAGQTCVAPDYVLVEPAVAPALCAALPRVLRAFYGDDPRQSPDYGRIVNRRHFDRLIGYLQPGRIVCGGQYDAGDLYLAPTVLTDVPPEAPVLQEEIFGPVLPVVEVPTLEAALSWLRDRPTPLALYLFTRNRQTQARVLAETRSGGVCLNDTVLHITGKDLPFGGLGESGLGRYHGRASFDCFSHQRAVLRRDSAWDLPGRYPPARLSLAALKRFGRLLLNR